MTTDDEPRLYLRIRKPSIGEVSFDVFPRQGAGAGTVVVPQDQLEKALDFINLTLPTQYAFVCLPPWKREADNE